MLGFCLNSCILGKLLCEMSYVAAKKVVDGCNNMTTFWSCCKTTILRHWSTAVHVISKVLWYGAKTGHNTDGDGCRRKKLVWNQQRWITQCTEVGGHGCKGRGNGWGWD